MANRKESKVPSHSDEEGNNTVQPMTDTERVQKITSNLRALLENGEDWQRKATSVPGVSVIRLPQSKTRSASLAVEINPLNDQGLPMKKKGVMIVYPDEITAFSGIFSDPRLPALIGLVNNVSGVSRKATPKGSTDIIEL